MGDTFINIFIAIVSGLAGAVANELFRKRKELNDEKKEKENKRRDKVYDIYMELKSKVRKISFLAPKDLLAEFTDTSKYDKFTTDEVCKIFNEMMIENSKASVFNEDLQEHLNTYIFYLNVVEDKYIAFSKYVSNLRLNNEVYNANVGEEVRNELNNLTNIVDSAFDQGKTGFVENIEEIKKNQDAKEINIMKNAMIKLNLAIDKDLGLLDK